MSVAVSRRSTVGPTSRTGTAASGKKYHSVTRDPAGDPNLFTSSPSRTGRRQSVGSPAPKEKVTVVTRDMVRSLTARPRDTVVASEAVVIKSDDYQRIKHEATRSRGVDEMRDEVVSARSRETASGASRKQKMQMHDAVRAAAQPESDLAIENKQTHSATINAAQTLLDEDLDEVKEMNELMHYAKVAAIRDAQMEEKRIVEQRRIEEEDRMHQMMEEERQAKIQEMADREHRRRTEQREGAMLIRQQIEDRKQKKFGEMQRLDEERDILLAHIEEMKVREVEDRKKKVETQRVRQEEIVVANNELARKKHVAKEVEKEEDMRILEYIAEKEKREEAFQAEQARIKAERTREVARVRAMQERTRDVQAERDELMAKRAAEAHERQWRAKEKAAAEKSARDRTELQQAREQQLRQKQRAIAIEARRERQEFDQVLEVQRNVAQAEQERAVEERRRREDHADQVRMQMELREEEQRRAREQQRSEGRNAGAIEDARRAKLHAIRERKLQELRDAGVPEKYMVDLAKMPLAQTKVAGMK